LFVLALRDPDGDAYGGNGTYGLNHAAKSREFKLNRKQSVVATRNDRVSNGSVREFVQELIARERFPKSEWDKVWFNVVTD
jgi:hypothetical protein